MPGSTATRNNLIDNVAKRDGPMAVGLVALAGAKNSDVFMESLIDDALSGLIGHGYFNRHIDYGVLGTNFFKTGVTGRKVGGKYILELCAAYVGTEPEIKLAEKLNKPMALLYPTVKAVLGVVDDWWFNMNLEEVLHGLPIPKRRWKDVREWAKYLACGKEEFEAPEFKFKYNNRMFNFFVGLDVDRYLRPEGGDIGSKYIEARDKNIVGGAWTNYDETGEIKLITPRVVNPSIILDVTKTELDAFGAKYLEARHIVSSEEMKVLQGARDYLAERIIPK